MSNTTLTPTVGAATLAGVALAMNLSPLMTGASAALAGLAPSISAVGAVAPGTQGKPFSWSGLLEGGVGASVGPVTYTQARFSVTGVFGGDGALVVDASPDGINWTEMGGINDPVLPGVPLYQSPGTVVAGVPGGIVIAVTDPSQGRLPYFRTRVTGGDGTTRLAVSANANNGAC